MSRESQIPMPELSALRWSEPPHWRSRPGLARLTACQLAAAGLVSASGFVLFGWHALRVLGISVAVAMLVESVFHVLGRRSRRWSRVPAVLIGLLTACTLPATAGWPEVVTASAVAVLIGFIIPGGTGNYLWHPVAVGRVAVSLLFGEPAGAPGWRVLAPGRLMTGDLNLAAPLPSLMRWSTAPLPAGVEAWQVVPPIEVLSAPIPVSAGTDAPRAVADLIARRLPPWSDTLTGVAGGAIGEACVLAVVAAGLLLIWQGLLRGRMVAAAWAMAAAAAAVLPVHLQIEGAAPQATWLPALMVHEDLPVGLVLVAFHLTAGGLPLVLLVLAADPVSTPLAARGQVIFGVGLAATAMGLRAWIGLPGSAYWALLVANTCVPVIDRLTRRRVLGAP